MLINLVSNPPIRLLNNKMTSAKVWVLSATVGGVLAAGGLNMLDEATQSAWDFCLRYEPYISNPQVEATIAFIAWFVVCLYFTYLDVTRSPTKIQKDYWPTNKEMLDCAVPQIIIYFVGCAFTWYLWAQFPDTHLIHDKKAPTFLGFVGQLSSAVIVGDFIIYWEHRLMHIIPYLRNNIHSVHHAYSAPFSWAGGWVHPFEDLIVVSAQALPAYLWCDPLTRYVFSALWAVLLIDEHSGHDVWWSPFNWMSFGRNRDVIIGGGADPHDIHHFIPTKNFSFCFCIWDRMFGTYMEPSELIVNPFVPPFISERREPQVVQQLMDQQIERKQQLLSSTDEQ